MTTDIEITGKFHIHDAEDFLRDALRITQNEAHDRVLGRSGYARWVAKQGARIVGYVSLLEAESDYMPSDMAAATGLSVNQHAVIARLAVDPGVRHRGIGEALLARAISRAQELRLVPALTVLEGSWMHHWYHRAGFATTPRVLPKTKYVAMVWGEAMLPQACTACQVSRPTPGTAENHCHECGAWFEDADGLYTDQVRVHGWGKDD